MKDTLERRIRDALHAEAHLLPGPDASHVETAMRTRPGWLVAVASAAVVIGAIVVASTVLPGRARLDRDVAPAGSGPEQIVSDTLRASREDPRSLPLTAPGPTPTVPSDAGIQDQSGLWTKGSIKGVLKLPEFDLLARNVVAFDGGFAVAAWTGRPEVWWTETGSEWRVLTAGLSRGQMAEGWMEGLVAGGPGLIAFGGLQTDTGITGLVHTSVDGAEWVTADIGAPALVRTVIDTPVGLMAVGQVDGKAAIWLSTDDGASFALGALGARPTDAVDAVWAGDRLVAYVAAGGGQGLALEAWASPDGQEWEQLGSMPFQRTPLDVVDEGDRLLAAGLWADETVDHGGVWESVDGVNWVPLLDAPGFTATSVAQLDDALVAFGTKTDAERGTHGTALFSTDGGTTWQPGPDEPELFPGRSAPDSVAAGAGRFFAIGSTFDVNVPVAEAPTFWSWEP